MGKKEPPDDAPEGAPEWIVTFSDLVSLLVTLFIMLLAFSSQETHDLQRAVNILKGSFGVMGDTMRDAAELIKSKQLQANVNGGGRKFDPDGAYIRHWVPELREVDKARVHDPAGTVRGYPEPMVDLAIARNAALERHARLRA